MNPVVKALIDELSKKDDEASKPSSPLSHKTIPGKLRLTPEQTALAIPLYLVYLAGLLTSTEPSVSASKSSSSSSSSSFSSGPPYAKPFRDRFQEYQTAYHQGRSRSNNSSMYSPSPRMLPTEEQQKVIDQDIAWMSKELESKAGAVVKALRDMEMMADAVAKKKQQQKKKKNYTTVKESKSTTQSDTEDSVDQEDNGEVPKVEEPTETLEQLQLQIQTKNASFKSEADDGAWITVSKTGSSSSEKDAGSVSPNKNLLENGTSQSFETQEILDDKKELNETPGLRSKSSEESNSPVQPLSFVDAVITSDDTINPFKAVASTSPTHQSALEERIRLLELRLSEKEEQWASERRDHAKALRLQKEQSDDLVQSLQLRLYISETRLKSYQDALDEHIQAVATNVAPNSSYSMSSPMRKGKSTDQDPPPSSPLISRVLQQQNRLEKIGD